MKPFAFIVCCIFLPFLWKETHLCGEIAAHTSSKDLKLAEDYYQQGDFDKVIETLPLPEKDREKQLLAIALRHKGRYEDALSLLKTLPKTPSIDLELAYTLIESGNPEEAQKIAQSLVLVKDPSLSDPAKLLMARLALDEKQFSRVEQLLKEVKTDSLNSSITYEKLYILGDLEFRKNNYLQSIDWLEKALPKRNEDLAPWTVKTLRLLGSAYLKQAEEEKNLRDQEALVAKAEKILTHAFETYPQIVSSLDIAHFYCRKAHILGDAAAFKAGREILERSTFSEDPEIKAKAFIVLGDHTYIEGIRTRQKKLFLESANYFQLASQLSSSQKEEAKIKQIQALSQEGTEDSLKRGMHLLSELPPSLPILPLLKADLLLKDKNTEEAALTLLEKKGVHEKTADLQMYLLGILYYKRGDFDKALGQFDQLIHKYPQSNHRDAALYWAARSLENAEGDKEKIRNLYRTLYQNHPLSPFAPEAYFYTYDESSYLLGDRLAIKHLHRFSSLFPHSPITLTALYLEGLDHLRDRRSPEGKWLSRKNITDAILSFQGVEDTFDQLKNKGIIAEDDLPRLTSLKNRAKLERAKANYTIAKESKGAKQDIYLNYAEEVFADLLKNPLDSETEEEALFYLALAEKEHNELNKAEATIQKIQDKQKESYYLAQSYSLLGKMAHEKGDEKNALHYFEIALSLKELLSMDEQLAIMLDQAESYKRMGHLDQAMLKLSEVVNFEAISSLRLKAMFLRAQVYAEQGRKALAKKQLESLALKGGKWALKAKEKLEKEYGYD